MKAALISQGSVSSKWTFEEMKKCFSEVDDLDLRRIEINLGRKEEKVLYDGKPLRRYDCVFAKGSFRFSSLLRAITKIVSKEAYMPIKSSAFINSRDKFLAQVKLEEHNITMPKTYLSSSATAAKRILEKIDYPIVMKLPEGTHGRGVVFADSHSSASSFLDALGTLKQPFIIQEFIETGGADIRALVIGNKVVAVMQRKAKDDEKRANIHAGGRGEPYELDSEGRKIAINAAKAIGAGVCAVDILKGAKGYFVIEVNLSPGLQGITKTTGINVAGEIAKYLYEQTLSKKHETDRKKTEHIMEHVSSKEHHCSIITSIDFRGDRILLPKEVTKAARFSEADEVELHAEEGKITITKLST